MKEGPPSQRTLVHQPRLLNQRKQFKSTTTSSPLRAFTKATRQRALFRPTYATKAARPEQDSGIVRTGNDMFRGIDYARLLPQSSS